MKRLSYIMLCVLILLSGCSSSAEGEEALIPVWYCVHLDLDTEQLMQSERRRLDASTDEIAMLLELMKEPMDGNLESWIPSSTELLDASERGGTLTLNLSEEYGQLTGISMTLANSCIVMTMTELDSVEQVQILVNGKALPEEAAQPMSRSNIWLSGAAEDPVKAQCLLHYPLADGSGLGTIRQDVVADGTTTEAWCRAVIQALSRNPDDDELVCCLDGDSDDLSITVRGTICTVQFGSSWKKYPAPGTLCRQALTDSLLELDGVNVVSILASK